MDINKDKYGLNDLITLMERLRNPNNGCPWDIEQDFNSIKPHTIEEAYEVADAIERGDMRNLKDELGDLLFQVIFYAQMATEQNLFTMSDIIDHVTKKMIFRHPHVFGDNKASDADDVKDNIWEEQKAKEKSDQTNKNTLDSITMALPSLLLANKIQKKVRKLGFEYSSITNVFEKLDEEVAELQQAINENNNDNIAEEYGDVLLVSTLLGTYLELNPEEELRRSSLKFIDRFNTLEDNLGDLSTTPIEEMIRGWNEAKDS